VPKVGHPQLVHAPHRLVELPLHVVLLHKRRHALLELLHRPPSPHTPHVHDPSAAVLLHQPLDERSNLRPPPLLHKPRRHKRHKPRRQHVIHNRPRNKVGKQRAHIRRVKRQVVDAPQRPDEPLKELLAPVHPRQPRQQQRRRLPLSAPLLQRNSYNPLHNHVPEPLLLQLRKAVLGLKGLGVDEELLEESINLLLEDSDGEGKLELLAHKIHDRLANILTHNKGHRLEEGLGEALVFEEVCDHVRAVLDSTGHVELEVLIDRTKHKVHASLHVRRLDRAADDEGGDHLAKHLTLLVVLVEGDCEHFAHKLRVHVPASQLLDGEGGIAGALAAEELLGDVLSMLVHTLDREGRALLRALT